MNGVLQANSLANSNNENTNHKSLNPIAEQNHQMSNDSLYEPNNNSLSQVCKQEQFRILNQRPASNGQPQTKDQVDNAKEDEQQMNLINNLNTFNMLHGQQNDPAKQAGFYANPTAGTTLLNSANLNGNAKTTQSNLNSQLSQYELKPAVQQYELSQEMLDKRVELLMRKYGEKAWPAAMLIQRFWRKRQMSKRFRNLALGATTLANGAATSQLKDASKSLNDLNLSGNIEDDRLNTSSDQSQMDLMEVSNSEIIITDKNHPLNNGQTNSSQQKLINATLEALKTPLATESSTMIQPSTKAPAGRSIMKRYSNASLQSTASSSSSSNASMPRSPTMPALQKNIFYNSNTGSILSNCSSSTAPASHSTSHILLNSSPLHPSGLLANGQPQLIYANGNNLYAANVCLTNSTNNLINSASFINPYFTKSNQTTPVLTPQHSLLNAMQSPGYLHSVNNNSQMTSSAMSLQSCLSNNLSRQSILSTLSNSSLLPQQLPYQQLAKQQQIQISQYETIRKRQYRIGLNLFNKRPPSRGIEYLISNGFIDVNLLNYAGFLIDSGLDSGLSSLTSGSSNSISTDKQTASANNEATSERELQLAAAVARFLLTRKGLSKQMIGDYLGDLQQPFNQLVLKFFVKQMDLSGLLIDVALRKYQTFFRFPGEAQKIEKLVEVFSEKYYQCNFENGINPSLYDAYTAAAVSSGRLTNLDEEANPEKIGLKVMSKDEIFILSFAIIMLNTDLHIPNNKRRMTPEQWIKNLKGVFKENGDLNETFLLDIYERIKQNEFKTGHDHCNHVLKVQQTLVPSSSAKQVPNLCLTSYRRLVCFCRLYEIVDINKKTTKTGQHQREVFLFNDMLLVTKLAKSSGAFVGAASLTNSSGGHSSSAATHNQYSYRRSILLSGCSVSLFSTNYYPYGIKLSQKTGNTTASTNQSASNGGNKSIIMFNARNDIDRKKFYEDLKESICEINEMEMIRISQSSTNGLAGISSNLSSSSSASSSTSSTASSSSSNDKTNQFSPTHPVQQNKTLHKTNSLLDLVKI